MPTIIYEREELYKRVWSKPLKLFGQRPAMLPLSISWLIDDLPFEEKFHSGIYDSRQKSFLTGISGNVTMPLH